MDELELIEKSIAEIEQDIAEATDLLAGTEIENDEARNENVIGSITGVKWEADTEIQEPATHIP